LSVISTRPSRTRTWSADITEIPTWEGKLYLAHVQDLFSRRIVGWAMASHMRKELVIEALEMAVARRRPAKGVIHHSDHGSQYTAVLFTGRCRQAGIEVSMGSIGDCFDNAVCESFHASLKKELIHRRPWPTRAEARTAIFDYIESWFNPRRRHSTLGYLSPATFEQAHHAQQLPARAPAPDGPSTTTPAGSHSAQLAYGSLCLAAAGGNPTTSITR
jgi:putative transposase